MERLVWIGILALVGVTADAQNRIGTGDVVKIYDAHCASCHGEGLSGGMGGSLLQGPWQVGSTADEMTRIIRDGIPELGMEAYGDVLSPEEIRALVIYIEERRAMETPEAGAKKKISSEGVMTAGDVKFRLEPVARSGSELWGIDFFPDGRAIVTERNGSVRILEDDKLGEPLEGTPGVWAEGQGGMLDVAVHPDYEKNGWIYLSFADPRDGTGMTSIVRGRVRDGKWTDEETVYQADDRHYQATKHHFGCRMVLRDGYLFFGIGDRGNQGQAQDLTRPNGKIHRLHDDGRVPTDNPFVDVRNACKSIWTLGNRNPQGLTLRSGNLEIWESEHGPRGGDEINLIEKGRNYGWPVITYGMNYNGTPITSETARPGMEQPKTYFLPSIGICGIAFYSGNKFPSWNGSLFVTGLSGQSLHRLELDGQSIVGREIVLSDVGRVRDVEDGPDGFLYVLINPKGGDRSKPGEIVRLIPE